ncbi:hypothetical protein FB45DRAFT_1023051 [Roridomyces roridus]|uniref:Uncharacterized protein n=1 Tax=Roridomyces roridus TaxID=1738132 RepID=A0AAD7FR30_9AGAR|nr:hypothetical protein FB45DRAFT_1023051 [Roridomyces roridus]
MADEDLRNDLLLEIQSFGEHITAEKVLAFLHNPEVRLKHEINREVTHKTACRYLDELGYWFTAPTKGQYVDGHEWLDVEWYHKDAPARPYPKGEGVSYMVADFFSADIGWLRHPGTGASARHAIRPGKNKDGYFTAVEVQEQAEAAIAIIKECWPKYDHIFVYDNATTLAMEFDSEFIDFLLMNSETLAVPADDLACLGL